MSRLSTISRKLTNICEHYKKRYGSDNISDYRFTTQNVFQNQQVNLSYLLNIGTQH